MKVAPPQLPELVKPRIVVDLYLEQLLPHSLLECRLSINLSLRQLLKLTEVIVNVGQ